MRRDQDFIIELVREIEKGKTLFQPIALDEAEQCLGFTPDVPMTREQAIRLEFHLDLLEEEGLVRIEKSGGASWFVSLTAAGHKLLASTNPGQRRP